jgi:prepilin signal peptidase PulO-like enzyme (type II secretory pathway)
MLSVSFILSLSLGKNLLSKILMIVFLFCLCCITYTDAQAGYIYDRFHIIILFVGIILSICDLSDDQLININYLEQRLFGCMLGGGFLELMNSLSIIILKKEGIGGGDVKLCFVCGLVLGFSGMTYGFILTFLPAALYTIISKGIRGQEISLGPFLCVSIAAVYCIGRV